MAKATIEPNGLVTTLFNRVYRTGITMMTTIDKAQKKSKSVNPKVIEDLETNYLLATVDLEYILESQLAHKYEEGWKLFVDSMNKLSSGEKLIFMGVVRNVKQTAENILSGSANPSTKPSKMLPNYNPALFPQITPGPLPWSYWNTDELKTFLGDLEKMETSAGNAGTNLVDAAALVTAATAVPVAAVASDKDVGTNIIDAAALATGAVATAAATATTVAVAAVAGSFAAGWHIGQAINEHMGWHN